VQQGVIAMDVLYVLRAQHDEMRKNFLDLGNDSAKAQAVLSRLLGYINAARECLYPELSDLISDGEALLEGASEHWAILAKISKSLEKDAKKGGAIAGKAAELSKAAEAYFQFEEQMVMPKVRSGIRTEEREDLGDLFLDEVADRQSPGSLARDQEFRA